MQITAAGLGSAMCDVRSTKPKSDELAKRRIAIKDNIAVAGVKYTSGIIEGKAACENNYFGTVSDTSITGQVHNPYAYAYSTGGPLSGSARFLRLQGRRPRNWRRLRRLDPSPVREPRDPGSDGIDDRQPLSWLYGKVKFGQEVWKHLETFGDLLLKGTRIGVLKEGFEDPMTDPNVAAASHAAIAKLTALGVELSQEAFDALGPGGQNIYLRGLFLQEKFGSPLHARYTNLLGKLNDEYEMAFRDVDVLVMPTIVFPPVKIEEKGGKSLGPLKMLSRTISATYNTATFNSTGHPGLSLPVGFVPARDDTDVWLPTGLQIMGRKWEDLTC
ncbi:amidase signature domain-containing protein [Leptodontidium sp. MPI-SDFR-AT-0119]|nr:amidase signature domain-containing protein [Leptodontidium sp. MPI-SDFR-AT-0119]